MFKFKKMIAAVVTVATLAATNVGASAYSGDFNNATYVGNCKLTFYCPCSSCSGSWGKQTATGTIAKQGRTIAVDPDVIPYGSTVYIEGWGYYVAEDCGGGVNGNHIDIYRDSHAVCRNLGVQNAKVYIVDEEWTH